MTVLAKFSSNLSDQIRPTLSAAQEKVTYKVQML
jgi:hypothetical protein